MYSQEDEERYILQAMQKEKIGRVLDVGAYDGITFSNTRRLLELGWEGVLVEPSPQAFIKLKENCEGLRGVTCVNVAVGAGRDDPTLSAFFNNPCGPVSTAVRSNMEKWQPEEAFDPRPHHVAVFPLSYFIIRYGRFDFYSLDAEGLSADMFIRQPWHEWKPKAICVEHDGRDVELAGYAQQQGYRVDYLNQTNVLFVRR